MHLQSSCGLSETCMETYKQCLDAHQRERPVFQGLPSGPVVYDPALPMQGARVLFLVWELRSHMQPKKKKKKKKKPTFQPLMICVGFSQFLCPYNGGNNMRKSLVTVSKLLNCLKK